jgi:hypothetical protein
MIEEFLLPNRLSHIGDALDAFARPFLPETDENRKRLRIQFRCAKEMNVVWHDDVTANRPAVTFACGGPLADQYLCDFFAREDYLPPTGARRDEVDRIVNPNSPKAVADACAHATIAGASNPAILELPYITPAGVTAPGYNTRA